MPFSDGPKFSLLFLLSLLLILHSPPANSDDQLNYQWNYCPTDANYTTNSTFQANLNLLLSSLSCAAIPTGFANDTKGQALDQVYGLALCGGDMSPAECRSCLNTSTQEIINRCPNGMSSAIWYEQCLLRYSDQSFFSIADTSYYYDLVGGLAPDPEQFKKLLGRMMDNLTTTAANVSKEMFATGVATFTNSSKLYGLVQCTRDLSHDECYRCLQDFVGIIPQCCDGRSGARVYGFSCYLRYESYPFFNPSKAIAWPPPTDAPVLPLALTVPTVFPSPPLPSPPTVVTVLPSPPTDAPVSPSAPTDAPVSTSAPTDAAVSPSPDSEATGSPPATNAVSGGKSGKTIKIFVTVITVVVVVLLLSAMCIYLRRRRLARKPPYDGDGKEIRSAESLVFDLETLRAATNNFFDANKLGQGGFGPVYKGILLDGQEIAVKRLSISSRKGLEQLRNEVGLVTNLQHRDLVKLLGYCLEEQEKLLVYEYLPNGSLDKFLFDPFRREQLEWGVRCRIIKRIGRGLLYLHEDSRLRIVHRDLKASNILLDRDMSPKISDFGLAKLFGMDKTHESTCRIAGTYGYMAPEYVKHGHFSIKSDVFSYGVLVLEIVTGRRNSGFEESGYAIDLPSYVWQKWNKGKASEVIDQSLGDRCRLQEVLRCIHIGLLCVQADPTKRPTMASAILMLDGNTAPIPSPSVPSFYVQDGTNGQSDMLKGVSSECGLNGSGW